MQEAEVSLSIAKYYIETEQAVDDVRVALDGAQIKTGDTVHFELNEFVSRIGFYKDCACDDKWQGRYISDQYQKGIIIHSHPGEGDVVIHLDSGRTLFIESKGFPTDGNKSSMEYPRMREAIGQLMTCPIFAEKKDLAVGVPDSPRSHELAETWSKLHQIQRIGIKFLLVDKTGKVSCF